MVRFREGLCCWRTEKGQDELCRANYRRKSSQADSYLYGVSTDGAAVRGYEGYLNILDPQNHDKGGTGVSCWRGVGANVCDCYYTVPTEVWLSVGGRPRVSRDCKCLDR